MVLEGKRIALLVEEHYEDLEVWYPLLRLREAGAEVIVVGTGADSYLSKHGMAIPADTAVEQIQADEFDAFIIPSGPRAEVFADHPAMTALIQTAIAHGKLIAAMASARQMALTEDGEGDDRARRFFELRAGVVLPTGPLHDSAVIREGNLLVARSPVDLPAFCRMTIAALADPPKKTPTL